MFVSGVIRRSDLSIGGLLSRNQIIQKSGLSLHIYLYFSDTYGNFTLTSVFALIDPISLSVRFSAPPHFEMQSISCRFFDVAKKRCAALLQQFFCGLFMPQLAKKPSRSSHSTVISPPTIRCLE
jgi:hypothetical protein